MQLSRSGWTVRHGGPPPSLLAALFVRDTLALSVDTAPDLPGLDPAVPVIVPRGVDRAAAAREWPGWWEDAVEEARADAPDQVHDVAETTTLRTRPALREAVIALRDDFYRFRGQEGAGRLPVDEVVRGVEARLGRRSRPFRLVITDLPVRGMVWERVAPAHVLASSAFLCDPMRTASALRQVVEDLA